MGPVGVPPDPPALLAPKPTFGVKPGLTSGIDVIGLAPPNWAYCAKAVVLVATSNKAESNIKRLLYMTSSFLFDGRTRTIGDPTRAYLLNRLPANTTKQSHSEYEGSGDAALAARCSDWCDLAAKRSLRLTGGHTCTRLVNRSVGARCGLTIQSADPRLPACSLLKPPAVPTWLRPKPATILPLPKPPMPPSPTLPT